MNKFYIRLAHWAADLALRKVELSEGKRVRGLIQGSRTYLETAMRVLDEQKAQASELEESLGIGA